MTAFAVHLNLGEHRELHAEGATAKRQDLFVAARLLAQEFIGREPEDFQPLIAVGFVQRFQPFVLFGQAAPEATLTTSSTLPR